MAKTTNLNNNNSKPEHFLISPESEPFLERVLFAARPVVLMVLAMLTIVFAYGLTQIKLDSSIEKYIPLKHEFIKNYLVVTSIHKTVQIHAVPTMNTLIIVPRVIHTAGSLLEYRYLLPL